MYQILVKNEDDVEYVIADYCNDEQLEGHKAVLEQDYTDVIVERC